MTERRCGRDCCGEGVLCIDESMRAGAVSKDENMGVDECYARVPLSSEYLDTTR